MMVAVDKRKRSTSKMSEVILEEVNIKELIVLEDDSIVNKSAKPNFKVSGQKYGKLENLLQLQLKSWIKCDYCT